MPKASEAETVVYCPGRVHTQEKVKITCPCGKEIRLVTTGPDVITCRDCHRELRKSDGQPIPVTRPILFVAKPGSTGTFKVQCDSNRCCHSQGAEYNGWYEVSLKANGAYTIKLLPRQRFNLRQGSAVVLGDR